MKILYKRDLVAAIDSVELLDTGIQTMRRGEPHFIAYRDIIRVRLRYAPVKGVPELFVCIVEPRVGKPLRFGSMTQPSLLEGYVLVPYGAFVKELHERILAAGGTPEFCAGDTTAGFGLRLIGTIVAACVIIGMVLSDKKLPGWMIIPLLVFLGWWGWPLIRSLRANETRQYNPRFIPDNLLPKDPV